MNNSGFNLGTQIALHSFAAFPSNRPSLSLSHSALLLHPQLHSSSSPWFTHPESLLILSLRLGSLPVLMPAGNRLLKPTKTWDPCAFFNADHYFSFVDLTVQRKNAECGWGGGRSTFETTLTLYTQCQWFQNSHYNICTWYITKVRSRLVLRVGKLIKTWAT